MEPFTIVMTVIIITVNHPSSPDVDATIVAAYSGAVVVDVVELNVVNKLT